MTRTPPLIAGAAMLMGLWGGAQAAPAAGPPAAAGSTKDAAGGLISGSLPNGLKYVVMRRRATPGEVELRLGVRVGSMDEAPGDEGVAHLLEHMAFRGSARFEDGAIMRTAQSLGAQPGADANASTTGTLTTYQLTLPHADTGAVATGLTILRDIGGALTLAQDKLEIERGVVLAEARDRASPQQEASRWVRRLEVGEHPFARPVIGRPEVIAEASSDQLRRFYDAYYRPERAFVVVVGDVDPQQVRRQIERLFGAWKGRGEAGRDPPPATAGEAAPRAEVVAIPGLTRTELFQAWPQPAARGREEAALFAVEAALVDARLAAGAGPKAGVYGAASLQRVEIPGVASVLALTATGIPNPKAALSATLSAVQQLKVYGPTQPELDAAVAARRADLAKKAEISPTAPNREVVRELVSNALSGRDYLSAEAALAAFDQAAPHLTPQVVSAKLRQDFGAPPSRILYVGPKAPAVEAAAIAAEAVAVTSRAPEPFEALQKTAWARPDFGPAGVVASRRKIADLGVTFVQYRNGARLTVKRTAYANGQATVEVRFGRGQLELPRDKPGPERLAATYLAFGGVRRMTHAEMSESLKGKSPPIEVVMGEDAFAIVPDRGAAVETAQLPVVLDAMAEQFSQPAWREEGWRVAEANAHRLAVQSAASAPDVLRISEPLLLHAGDPRYAPPFEPPAARWPSQPARDFLDAILRHAAPEVVVVGDVDVDQVISVVAANFGALSLDPARPDGSGAPLAHFPSPAPEPLVVRHHGRPDEAAIDISWPTTDRDGHPRDYAAALVLSDLIRQRLVDDLRARMGEIYTPIVVARFSPTVADYGRISVDLSLKPEHIPIAFETIDRIAAELASGPVAADEFQRAQRPRAAAVSKAMQRNEVWAAELGGAQDHPLRLDYLRRAEAEVANVTPASVQAAAKAWLGKGRSFRVEVVPYGPAPETVTPAVAGNAQP